MYEIFEKLCKERGITAYRFCKDAGVNASTISTWKKNHSFAGPELSKKVCEYFNISHDYLMTGKEKADNEVASLILPDDEDIKKHIDKIMESLKDRDKIVYDGAEVTLTDYNKKLLRRAMEMAYDVVESEKENK